MDEDPGEEAVNLSQGVGCQEPLPGEHGDWSLSWKALCQQHFKWLFKSSRSIVVALWFGLIKGSLTSEGWPADPRTPYVTFVGRDLLCPKQLGNNLENRDFFRCVLPVLFRNRPAPTWTVRGVKLRKQDTVDIGCFEIWTSASLFDFQLAAVCLEWTADERTPWVEMLPPRCNVRRQASPASLFICLCSLWWLIQSCLFRPSGCGATTPYLIQEAQALRSLPCPQEHTSAESASVLVWVLTTCWFWCLETHNWNEYILFFSYLAHYLYPCVRAKSPQLWPEHSLSPECNPQQGWERWGSSRRTIWSWQRLIHEG